MADIIEYKDPVSGVYRPLILSSEYIEVGPDKKLNEELNIINNNLATQELDEQWLSDNNYMKVIVSDTQPTENGVIWIKSDGANQETETYVTKSFFDTKIKELEDKILALEISAGTKVWTAVFDTKNEDLSSYSNTASGYLRTHTFKLKPNTKYQLTTDMSKDTEKGTVNIYSSDANASSGSRKPLTSTPTEIMTGSDGNIYITLRPSSDPEKAYWNPNHEDFTGKLYGVIVKEFI